MGLNEAAYDIVALPFPPRGVNTTIAPQTMPVSFGYHLENIYPSKESTGSVRHGTVEMIPNQVLPDDVIDAIQLEAMPYIAADGTQHILSYVAQYIKDVPLPPDGLTWLSKNSLSFVTNEAASKKYIEDSPLKIIYAYTETPDATRTRYGYVKASSFNAGTGLCTVEFYGTELPETSVLITSVWYSVGAIYRVEGPSQYTLLTTNLTPVCIPRFQQFMNDLVIVNGVDPNMIYDGGNSIKILQDYANKIAGDIQQVAPNDLQRSITFLPAVGERAAAYLPGTQIQLVAKIEDHPIDSIVKNEGTNYATVTLTNNHNFKDGILVSISGVDQPEYNGDFNIFDAAGNSFRIPMGMVSKSPATGTSKLLDTDYTIEGIVQSSTDIIGNRIRIDFQYSVLPGFIITLTQLKTLKPVPTFSYIYAAHNRLWALGAGVPHPNRFREGEEKMKVYFTFVESVTTRWFNDNGAPAFLETARFHPVADNLEAIRVINGGIVFFGREACQVWAGTTPAPVQTQSFFLDRTLPVGCLHGNLIQSIPNDEAFISKYGLRTLSNINVAKEFATSAEVGGAIDKSIAEQMKILLADRQTYLRARSFKYAAGQMLGMRLVGKPLVYVLTDLARGWVFFSGDFARANTYCVDHRNRLLLGIGPKLYRYADGDALNLNWKDAVSGRIYWVWITPWLKPAKGRWANYRYEAIMNPGPDVEFKIAYSLNNNRSATLIDPVQAAGEGGFFGSAQFGVSHFGSDYKNPTGRLKFVGSTFALGIAGETEVGPIDIAGIRLYGERER